jgi:tetratricopeptide (TPR) repeat protein
LPELPGGLDDRMVSNEVRAALQGLREDTAAKVTQYLLAAEMAEDDEQAYEYARAARGLAARIGVVREVAGAAAYRAGKWAEALAELRAARRLTGRNDYLPVMADAERALGRPDRALALIRSDEASELDRAGQIELRIVESGIRRDQGRPDSAVLVLRVPELTDGRQRPWSARLLYAYGEALLATGDQEAARDAFAKAADIDSDNETGAAERLDELDGITVDDLDGEFLDDEDDEDDEPDDELHGDEDDEPDDDDLDDEDELDEDDDELDDEDLDDDALEDEDDDEDLDDDDDLEDEPEDDEEPDDEA